MEEGFVFNIQKYSVHDGGGIRTVVFMKGCPMRCPWCSNPESQDMGVSRIFWKNRCIGCKKCIDVCPIKIGNRMQFNQRCKLCMACTDVCPSKALESVGKMYTTGQIIEIIQKDMMFYDESGGGVTLSGGEPLMQWAFAADILKECHELCMNTAMETTGFAPYEHLKEVSLYCDRLLYDIKHMDNQIHKKYTGVENRLILENLKKVRALGKEVIIRIPLIHHVNDSDKNIIETGKLAKETGIDEIHLLPFHKFGEPKYEGLGRKTWEYDAFVPQETIKRIQEILAAEGFKVCVGG